MQSEITQRAVDALASRAIVVLKDTTHPGNIGAAARAMKTCGLQRLVLVSPQTLIDGQSRAMSAGALDVLQSAVTVSSLAEAISECAVVFAYTARRRELSPQQVYSFQAGALAAQHIRRDESIALLFGGEKSGLETDDVRAATYAVEIPANPQYSSLNLAQAVQIACYDLRRSLINAQEFAADAEPMPTQQELRDLYDHANRVIETAQMPKRGKGKLLLPRLTRLITRAKPTASEVRLLRGILKALTRKINNEEK